MAFRVVTVEGVALMYGARSFSVTIDRFVVFEFIIDDRRNLS